MPKIFPVTVRKTYAGTAPPPSGDEVNRERLTYDRPELAPIPTERSAIATAVSESSPYPIDTAVAAVLAQANEDHPFPVDIARITATATGTEASPAAASAEAIATFVAESAPAAADVQGLQATIYEASPAPVESDQVRVSPTSEPAPISTDTESISAAASESAPIPVDSEQIVLAGVYEVAPAPIDTANILATVTVNDAAPISMTLDALATRIAELAPNATDTMSITLTYRPGATTVTQVAATRSDWTTPANAQGKPDLVFSTITGNALAARSGRLNAAMPAAPSSVTGNFTITAAVLRFYLRAQLPAGGTVPQGKVGYAFNGGADVLLDTLGVNGATTDYFPAEYDITSLIAGSWANVPLVVPYCLVQLPILNTSTYSMDAFVIAITATRSEP